MITGAHSIIYSQDARADRKFLSQVLRLQHIDAGSGWPIYALPASELAIHPAPRTHQHEVYLQCDDIVELHASLTRKKVKCTKVQRLSWGLLTRLSLPGGGKLGIYQPLHSQPGRSVE